jgi:hypothetical protein
VSGTDLPNADVTPSRAHRHVSHSSRLPAPRPLVTEYAFNAVVIDVEIEKSSIFKLISFGATEISLDLSFLGCRRVVGGNST